MSNNERKAIVMMDVKGSSALWAEDAARMSRNLDKLYGTVSALVKSHKGVMIKTIGDAFMLAFDTVEAALRMALEFQLAWRRTAAGKVLVMRIGIAHGQVRTKNWAVQGCKNMTDYFGNTVNVASRLESHLCPPGGIAITPANEDIMNILWEHNGPESQIQNKNHIEHIKVVDYRDEGSTGERCNYHGLLGLKRSARCIPFSMSCRSTLHLKNVKPFKALSVQIAP